ncbi:MAG: hypothetical protein R3E31_24265 [Chloroflexota bacterium]
MKRLLVSWLWLLLFLSACGSAAETNLEGSDTLFHDEFVAGQTGSWVLEGDVAGRTSIVGEQLHIQVDAPATMQFATLSEPTFTDFVLEVDARQLAGDLQSSYGVLLRMQDAAHFYRFDITGDGLYTVERRNGDGSWTRFVEDWTGTAAINQGLSVVNRLRVEANGPTMRFYVNDALLYQVTDGQYAGGTIALDAGTFGQAGLEVAFDNVVVQQP